MNKAEIRLFMKSPHEIICPQNRNYTAKKRSSCACCSFDIRRLTVKPLVLNSSYYVPVRIISGNSIVAGNRYSHWCGVAKRRHTVNLIINPV